MHIMSIPRWAILIDIEGFSKLYGCENQILLALCDLIEGIFLKEAVSGFDI